MRSLQKRPSPKLLKSILRRLVEMTPREFIEHEPGTIAEQMMMQTVQTGIEPGAKQIDAFNAVWDRTEGPVNQREDEVRELHIKVIGAAPPLALTEHGDAPYGSADREQAEERAGGAEPQNGRRDLPGDGPGAGPGNGSVPRNGRA